MARQPHEYKTYAEKMRRANKEALYTVVALAIIIAAWIIGGIGLSGLDFEVASTPIWIIGGTIGPWLVAVVIAIVFAKRVFANFSLEDDEDESEVPGTGVRADDSAPADANAVIATDKAGEAR